MKEEEAVVEEEVEVGGDVVEEEEEEEVEEGLTINKYLFITLLYTLEFSLGLCSTTDLAL